MGWTFNINPGQTKADFVRECLALFRSPCTVERHAVVGNHLWAIVAHPEMGREIVLFLMQKARSSARLGEGGWGYKDMTESMGPCYYTCPLAFLDAVPVPEGEQRGAWARAWRDKVRAYHASKASKRKALAGLREGCTVRLVEGCKVYGQPITEAKITSVRPLRGVVLNGYPVKLRPGLVAGVL